MLWQKEQERALENYSISSLVGESKDDGVTKPTGGTRRFLIEQENEHDRKRYGTND
jgi:hypothetical protein